MSRVQAALLGLAGITVIGLNIALLPRRYALHVPVEILQKSSLPRVVRAGGTVEPKRSLVLKAEFDGPVVSKRYKEGDNVRVGQLLLEIGRDKIRLDYNNRVIALQNAKADLIKDRKDARVEKALFEKGAVPQSNVEDAQRAVVRAVQAVKTADEDFRLQEDRWNKNKIYAAFDGTILKDSLGDDLAVSAAKEIVTLGDISDYSVVAKVDELEIGQIHLQQKAVINLQAYSDMSISARVSDIGSQAEANGVTEIPVTLTLEKVSGLVLRPNLTATVSIVTGQFGEVVSIPLTALSNTTGETRVWTVDSSGRLRPHSVTLGQSNPDRTEITQGLIEGDRVCITADPHFVEGMKVIAEKSFPSDLHRNEDAETSGVVMSSVRQLPGGGPPPEILERIKRMHAVSKRKDD